MDGAAAVDSAATGLAETKTVAGVLAALPLVAAQQPSQKTKRNGIKLKKVAALSLTTSSRSQYLNSGYHIYYILLLYCYLSAFIIFVR